MPVGHLWNGSNAITDVWGTGNFVAITFEASDWTKYTSVKVGLLPTEGSGFAELIGHLDDLDSVFKITDKGEQIFRVVATNGTNTIIKDYQLGELVTLGYGS